MPLTELEDVFRTRLQIQPGQTLFIHSSYSDLKVDATPEQVVQLLIKLVGPSGNILMPFYPLKSSYEWLQEGRPFNVKQNRTSMGAIAMALGSIPETKKSLHPTKSVAVWGKDQTFLISDHALSPMPYGERSPYYRVMELPNSRILGIGVNASRLSCVHAAVDTTPDYPIQPYHPDALEGIVKGYDGEEIKVKTYAHDLMLTNKEDVPRFLRETQCPTYREIEYKDRIFFSVDAKAVIEHTKEQSKKGKTFFYPSSLNFQQPKRRPA